MTQDQANEIVMFMRAATASRVEQSTIDYYQAALLKLDFDLALQATTIGTVTWRRFPSWAEFKEVYRAQQRLREPVGEQREDLPEAVEAKRGVAAPEWVWVWSWARTERSPRQLRPFPQQEGYFDPKDVMTTTEYEELRKEWTQEGSPKADRPLPMAR